MKLQYTCPICRNSFSAYPCEQRKHCSKPCQTIAARGLKIPVREQFENKIDKTSSPHGCWLFRNLSPNGYGQFGVGRGDHQIVYTSAHRFAYELYVGPIPKGLLVLHNCPGGDNPSCCNPQHLWVGDQRANIQDAIRKGRRPMGVDRVGAKLTDTIVREMRALRDCPNPPTYAQLAERFGVRKPTAMNAIKGKTWKHIA